MSTTNETRAAFLAYFGRNGHQAMPSSPLVPHNDPTLMFTNAGMVQFKDIFTGRQAPPSPPRAATSQKCVRAGGKHNDLDNVGYTARHHTFFEMLGNFSFGDYFKEGAILHAWELLTKEFALPPDKLGVTVYHTDDEAFELWKKITGFPDSKILRVPTRDNFWAMGDTGPCGPCSEIFYDHGTGEGAWALDGSGHDLFGERFVEIWNLVFMQYEQVDADTRLNLPKPSIDTGMGLERMSAVLQGVHDNYDTDQFKTFIAASEALTSTKAQGEKKASHRVIADHLRSSCFLIADGVLPSNEGRGYVLRRIMRRAMRHAHMLGAAEPLMHRLVPTLTAEMGKAYPELLRAEALIANTLKSEEERFRETLGRGLKLLEEEIVKLALPLREGGRAAKLQAGRGSASNDETSLEAVTPHASTPQEASQPLPLKGGAISVLPGDIAFKLYDTYGFPLDLTQDILRAEGMAVDEAGFNACMQEQKARARAAWRGSGDATTATVWFDLKEQHGVTEFLGYMADTARAAVLAMVKDGQPVAQASAGDTVQLLVNQTPFYGESGGQVGDSGWLLKDGKPLGEITYTTKPLPDLHVHHVTLSAPLKAGEAVELAIDADRRNRIRANHSATHLLHAALRHQLGGHITQKGSLVDAERLRFDISHPEQITHAQRQAIEDEVNAQIWRNAEVSTKLMKPDEAIEAGAMALFGEKYGDEVRVLSMGMHDTNPAKPYSVELCGGTHVGRTGDIGLFKITAESAIAAGVRRIEGVTRDGAYAYLREQEQALAQLALEMKTPVAEVSERVAALQKERKQLQKELAEAKKQLALGGGGQAEAAPEMLGEIAFIARHFPDLPPKELRTVANELLQQHAGAVIVLTSASKGKASVLVAVSENLTQRYDAAEFVRLATPLIGGQGGGGRPTMAQGGGPDADKAEAPHDAIRMAILSRQAA